MDSNEKKRADKDRKEILESLERSEMKLNNKQKEEIVGAIEEYKMRQNSNKGQKNEWKKRFFGTENPSFKHLSISAVVFCLLGLAIYTADTPYFFPSPEWEKIGSNVVSLLIFIGAAIVTGLVYNRQIFNSRKDKPPFQGTRAKVVCGMIVFPIIIWLILWVLLWPGFFLGFCHAYTEIYGVKFTQVIPAEKTGREGSLGAGKYGIPCDIIESPIIRQSLNSQLCFANFNSQYKSVPHSFSMELIGKKSWFGFVVEKYALPIK